MTYLRRFFAMLTPSPLACIASFLTALAVGYLLWAELEPAPRHVTNVDGPKQKNTYLDQATLSPDGRSVVFHYISFDEPFDPERQSRQSAIHLYDLATTKQMVLSEQIGPPIIFAPDGKQLAGFWQDTVYVWDRDTGREQKRYSVKTKARQKDFDPLLTFLPEDLVLLSDWTLDENANVQQHMIAVAANKPWNGNETEFDRMREAQRTRPLFSRVSTDGKRSVSIGKTGLTVSDSSGAPPISIPVPPRFEMHGDVAILHDGKTLIACGECWLPIRTACAWLNWVYFAEKNPTATEGMLLVDVDSGAEIVFVHGRGECVMTPDGKSFVVVRRSPRNPGATLTIYDWPLNKPWGQIVAGALLAFVTLILVSKAWRWFRGTPKLSEEDAPRTKPPWETDETPAVPRADSSNHAD